MTAVCETPRRSLCIPHDIPTALTFCEAGVLYQLAAGKNVLEFGSLLGQSTVIMAQSAKKVFAVDPHEGYPSANPRATLAPFLANLTRYGVREKVVPILSRGQDVAPLFAAGFFGLVFIDITCAAGELLDIAHDLDPDVIALHDFGIPAWDGATIAVRNYQQRTGRQFKIIDTLAIFEREYLRG